MKKSRILMGALALAMVAATFFACNKEKTTQQETPAAQQTANPNDLTLAEIFRHPFFGIRAINVYFCKDKQ